MNRTLYIGDAHGCADELEAIVERFGFVRGSDTLCQIGDILNKGPDMMRALRFVVENRILTVLGNHEAAFLRAMETPSCQWSEKQRMRFGGLSAEDRTFIRETVKGWPLWRDTPYALMVHAGLEPGKTRLEDMRPEALLSIREWNGKPWYEQVTWPKTVVFGHWAKNGFVHRPGFVGLDSGCVYGKRLTAWCPEEDHIYEIPARRIYVSVKEKTEGARASAPAANVRLSSGKAVQ